MGNLSFVNLLRFLRYILNGQMDSIGSSGRIEGGKKHEIYVAAFGGHLFYDLFVQGWRGAMAPSAPPWIRY